MTLDAALEGLRAVLHSPREFIQWALPEAHIDGPRGDVLDRIEAGEKRIDLLREDRRLALGIALWRLVRNTNSRVLVTAPSMQQSTMLVSELWEMLQSSPLLAVFKPQGKVFGRVSRIRVAGRHGGILCAASSAQPERFQGFCCPVSIVVYRPERLYEHVMSQIASYARDRGIDGMVVTL